MLQFKVNKVRIGSTVLNDVTEKLRSESKVIDLLEVEEDVNVEVTDFRFIGKQPACSTLTAIASVPTQMSGSSREEKIRQCGQHCFLLSVSGSPSDAPSISRHPSEKFSTSPSESPSELPSESSSPSISRRPSEKYSMSPSESPSESPSKYPSQGPSVSPSESIILLEKSSILPSFFPSQSILPSQSSRPSKSPVYSPITEANGFIFNEKSNDCTCYQNLDTSNAGVDTTLSDSDLCYEYTPGSTIEMEVESKLVRFQYDGTLKVGTVTLTEDNISNKCRKCAQGGIVTCSNHVLEKAVSYTLEAKFYYQIIDLNINGQHVDKKCNQVSPGEAVVLKNEAGPDAYQAKKLLKSMEPDDYEELMKCSEQICERTVVYEEDRNGSFMRENFISGPPNQVAKIILKKLGCFEHNLNIVITGSEEKDGSQSIQYPTHNPLLVLRDPPGGNSYVQYQNVVTTFVMKHTKLERHIDYESKLNIQIDQGEMDDDGCVGFGAMICKSTLYLERGMGTKFENDQITTIDYNEDSKSFHFTSLWSYSTSQEAEHAGQKSDVALVPNIDVSFVNVDVIGYNEGTCQATYTEEFRYDLTSDKNKPAFSFFTFDKIKAEMIPLLKKMHNQADTHVKKVFLDEAIQNWEFFLVTYEEATEAKNLVNAKKVNHWFRKQKDNFGASELRYDDKPLTEQHWEGIVPEEFDVKATKVGTEEAKEDFENISRIQFSGGGNTMEIQLSIMEEEDETSIPGLTLFDLGRHISKEMAKGKAIKVLVDKLTDQIIKTLKAQGQKQIKQKVEESAKKALEKAVSPSFVENLSAVTKELKNELKTKKLMNSGVEQVFESVGKGTADEALEKGVKDGSKKMAKEVGKEGVEKASKSVVKGIAGPEAYLIGLGVSMGIDTFAHFVSPNENSDFSLGYGSEGDSEINLFGFGPDSSGEDLNTYGESRQALEGLAKSKETSVTLFLGDPNNTDEFAVDIFLDPTHGTFIFKTTSGISSCPWVSITL